MPADVVVVVVVHAEEVDRLRDVGEVAVVHVLESKSCPRRRRARRPGSRRATAGSRNIRFHRPSMRRAASRSTGSVGSFGTALVRLSVMPSCSGVRASRSAARGEAVGEVLVVQGGERRRAARVRPGRVLAAGVADEGGAERLVEGGPVRDPVAEGVVHERRRTRAKRSAVSRLAQPPVSSSACGRSQW